MNTEIRNWPHFAMEMLSIMLLICCFVPLLAGDKMTGVVPTHFDAAGNVDGTGTAKDMVYLPLASLFIFVLMTLGEKFPRLINIPGKHTDRAREYLTANGWKLMRETKLCVMFLMAYMCYWTWQIALGKAETMPMWGIWLPFCAMMAVLGIFLYKIYNRT